MRSVITLLCFVFLTKVNGQTLDEKGRKQGYWKKTDETTKKLIYEGEFKEGVPVGVFKYYYPNDSVRALMTFRNAGKTAFARLFHMNGKPMALGKYVGKEIKDSVWTYFDEGGVLISRDSYKMGKKEGVCFVYLPDGGKSQERTYKNDFPHGEYKEYFDGYHLRSKGQYIAGNLDGRIVYYYPNGIEAAAGYYRNGKKNGPWIYKTESGKIREKELYKNGKLATEKETTDFFSKNPVQDKTKETKPVKSTSASKSKKPLEVNHE